MTVLYGLHNHAASADPFTYPAHRIAATDTSVITQIKSFVLSGLSNAKILTTIQQQFPKVILTQKDVSNIIQKSRIKQLARLTSIQWLLQVCLR
jgi:hypothetical protein